MAVETEADRAAMMSTDYFGSSAVWRKPGKNPATISGLFFQDFEQGLEDVNEAPVGAPRPAFQAQTSVLAQVARGDLLTVEGTNYRIKEIVPDGTGLTVLFLGVTES